MHLADAEDKITFSDVKTVRHIWMDCARGIGIVLVVIGHVERGLTKSNILDANFWSILDFSLYTFHMPLFFLLAGMNASSGLSRGRQIYLSSKIGTLIYPYFFWSALQWLIMILMSSYINAKMEVFNIFEILWKPLSQFWFLYVLFMLQLNLALLGNGIVVTSGLAVSTLLGSQLFKLGTLPEQYLHAAPFFLLGVILRKQSDMTVMNIRPSKLFFIWLLFAITVAGSIHIDPKDYDDLWNLPCASLGIAGVIAVSKLIRSTAKIVLIYLGQNSMSIYVMHIIFAAGARIALNKLNTPHVGLVYLFVCSAIGIVGPLCVYSLLSKLKLLKYSGLPAVPRVNFVNERD